MVPPILKELPLLPFLLCARNIKSKHSVENGAEHIFRHARRNQLSSGPRQQHRLRPALDHCHPAPIFCTQRGDLHWAEDFPREAPAVENAGLSKEGVASPGEQRNELRYWQCLRKQPLETAEYRNDKWRCKYRTSLLHATQSREPNLAHDLEQTVRIGVQELREFRPIHRGADRLLL